MPFQIFHYSIVWISRTARIPYCPLCIFDSNRPLSSKELILIYAHISLKGLQNSRSMTFDSNCLHTHGFSRYLHEIRLGLSLCLQYQYITTMSNILRTKNGNLSKVKYFLPGARGPNQQSNSTINNKSKQSRSITKKPSVTHQNHNQSVASNGDISFQIVGIHENSQVQSENHDFTRSNNHHTANNSKINIERGLQKLKSRNGEKVIQASLSSIRALTNSREWTLPEGSEKQEFYRFIETLKDDQTYQHTITMFTIMYFYQGRKKKSIR